MPQLQLGSGRFRDGYTLMELITVTAIIGLILSMVLSSFRMRVNNAKLEASVNEMQAIAQASLDYYSDHFPTSFWPSSPGDLYPKYLYTNIQSSPFGNEYQINSVNNMLTVSTLAPSGLAQNYYQGSLLRVGAGLGQDTLSITKVIPNGIIGRLRYEKKNP